MQTARKTIRKLGSIDCDLVETTPVVFDGRLYRFEYVRTRYIPNKTGGSYFRFIDVKSGSSTPQFAAGYHLGCAFVDAGTAYVYGVDTWGASSIRAFWSKDLVRWESRTVLSDPRWKIFNTSVCAAGAGYIMAIELGEPPEEVGKPFTMRFARSVDPLSWKVTPVDCVFSKDRYTACPAIRFYDGWLYMVYLEEKPGPEYEQYIVRSRDLVRWESSPLNPVLRHTDEDKRIANPRLSKEQRSRIAQAVNINNSDLDFCEHKGKTVIYYSWGDQQGTEFLAEAKYDGSLQELCESYFPAAAR